jgi:hypothetical protein
MNNFINEIFKQITGKNFNGETIAIGWKASNQMRELGLDTATIEDVFKNGRTVTTKVQEYQNAIVSESFRWDTRHNRWEITSVRLYKRENHK